MAFYLFPGVVFDRLTKADSENIDFYQIYSYVDPDSPRVLSCVNLELQDSFNFYELCTKQYLGFGVLLQFLPGTNANLARKQLSNELESVIQDLKNSIADQPEFINYDSGDRRFNGFKKRSSLSSLSSYLNLSPLFKLFDDIVQGVNPRGIAINEKLSLIKLAFTLPILNDIFLAKQKGEISFRHDALKNILYSILNPVRIIDDALNFLHQGAYRILDIGAQRLSRSSLPRILIKGTVGLLFGIIKSPVKILRHAIDLPLSVVNSLVIKSVAHFIDSIQDSYQNRDKKILIATKKELQDVKELRQAAKGYENTSYSSMKNRLNYTQEYIGITKGELYRENSDDVTPERVVAIRASSEKIASTASLLSIVSFHKTEVRVAKMDLGAIEAAQAVLGLNLSRS